jgi:hypothetical protein
LDLCKEEEAKLQRESKMIENFIITQTTYEAQTLLGLGVSV